MIAPLAVTQDVTLTFETIASPDDDDSVCGWLQGLQMVILDCLDSESDSGPYLLRRTHQLLENSPAQFNSLVGQLMPSTVLEVFIAAGAHESAALRFFPQQLGFILSRGPKKTEWLASACLEGEETDITFVGSNPEAALIGAYLSVIVSHQELQSRTSSQSSMSH